MEYTPLCVDTMFKRYGFYMHGLYIVVCVFGVFLLAIVFSVLLLTDSDYPFWYLQTHLSFPGKVKTVTVNNVTNMNYTNTTSYPKTFHLEKVRDQWRWKCMSWRGTDTKPGLNDLLWRTGSLSTIKTQIACHKTCFST